MDYRFPPNAVRTPPVVAQDFRTLVETVGLRLVEVSAIIGSQTDARNPSTRDFLPSATDWRNARIIRLAELLATISALLQDDAGAWLRAANVGLGHRSPLSLLIEEPDALPRLSRILREEVNQ